MPKCTFLSAFNDPVISSTRIHRYHWNCIKSDVHLCNLLIHTNLPCYATAILPVCPFAFLRVVLKLLNISSSYFRRTLAPYF